MVVRRALRPGRRRAVAALLDAPRYELVPLPKARGAARHLPPGATVTVTSSPSRGPAATLELAETLAAEGFHAVPHLAARQVRAEDELARAVDRLAGAGVRDVFVVGGDTREVAGPYPDGLALLRALDRLGRPFEQVGVPSYPEGHHTIPSGRLWEDLAAKQDLATYTVTQLCFDADAICEFTAEAERRGIRLPVRVGVPGAVDLGRLLRISLRVGVGESLRFARSNVPAATRLLRPRGYRPDALLRRLADRVSEGRCDVAGLHIYTFNQVAPTVAWLQQVRRRAAA